MDYFALKLHSLIGCRNLVIIRNIVARLEWTLREPQSDRLGTEGGNSCHKNYYKNMGYFKTNLIKKNPENFRDVDYFVSLSIVVWISGSSGEMA